jgi:hypothetical protein
MRHPERGWGGERLRPVIVVDGLDGYEDADKKAVLAIVSPSKASFAHRDHPLIVTCRDGYDPVLQKVNKLQYAKVKSNEGIRFYRLEPHYPMHRAIIALCVLSRLVGDNGIRVQDADQRIREAANRESDMHAMLSLVSAIALSGTADERDERGLRAGVSMGTALGDLIRNPPEKSEEFLRRLKVMSVSDRSTAQDVDVSDMREQMVNHLLENWKATIHEDFFAMVELMNSRSEADVGSIEYYSDTLAWMSDKTACDLGHMVHTVQQNTGSLSSIRNVVMKPLTREGKTLSEAVRATGGTRSWSRMETMWHVATVERLAASHGKKADSDDPEAYRVPSVANDVFPDTATKESMKAITSILSSAFVLPAGVANARDYHMEVLDVPMEPRSVNDRTFHAVSVPSFDIPSIDDPELW